MSYENRLIEAKLNSELKRGKSILLLGPRQTGKTTLVKKAIDVDLKYNFADITQRLRYEKSPEVFVAELKDKIAKYRKQPLIFIDEIQKIPIIMDAVQVFIDEEEAQFILSGSSARKLKHGSNINLLPGRVTAFTMSPFLYSEIKNETVELDDFLVYGTLPRIINSHTKEEKEIELNSYVNIYLEDEIRAEAVVRNIGSFAKFLQVAAGESGRQLNFSRLSQDVGVADTTVKNYYQILEDCLVAHRIDPITKSTTNRRLLKSPKFLFFDLGVRRVAANEGVNPNSRQIGDMFEQYIGLELINYINSNSMRAKLRYWRDTAGPEVDYVIEHEQKYIPIEVKYTDKPDMNDAKHLVKFMQEYNADTGYVVCRTPNSYKLSDAHNITAISWQDVTSILYSL